MRNWLSSKGFQMKQLITTSWDDGHPLDIKLARLLHKYGIKGTFYITPRNRERERISDVDIRLLSDMGMEVGSHTMTHPYLDRLTDSELHDELKISKQYLERVINRRVISFCYPKGIYDDNIVQTVKKTGYRLARTTASFRLDKGFDPWHFPVSVHFYPHNKEVLFRHNLKHMNIRGIMQWGFNYHFAADPIELGSFMLESMRKSGGTFHLWGHSWEIDKLNLWEKLEKMLQLMAQSKAKSVTNSQLIAL